MQAICEYFDVAYVPPAEDDSGTAAEPSVPEEKPQENALYRVQVGAVRVLANAEAFRAKAEAAGFDGAYVVKVES